MKYYLIAGEASGDLHGSNLIKGIRSLDSSAEIRCWGGDKMEEAGGVLAKHIRTIAFMGFIEVIKNLKTILKNIRFCKEDISDFKPDILVLIDYPGFNLRIAKWAKKNKIKTVYYISPQVWAWKENRVRSIKRNVDKMLVIFPFEKTFYEKWNYEVEYIGHPLVPVIEKYKKEHSYIQKVENTIALLPGSRKQEIDAKLPVMLQATKLLPENRFIIAKSPNISADYYSSFLKDYPDVYLFDQTYTLLMQAEAAVVTSGTATLETALFNVPEVICYLPGKLTYILAKQLIKLKFICIVNLIMNKEVVKELIQSDLTPQYIAHELDSILNNQSKKDQILNDYKELKKLLEYHGDASQNAAEIIFSMVKPS